MNKFSIKAFGIRKSSIKISAFTVAEMLLVLLIISFLIIAIPPLVNKKIAKKVIRGEHGRYECWIDPADGATYEYLATERHGVGALFMGAGGSLGRKLGPNERCRFKPAEMAPTAPYFVMQIIGGGGGGAYAPYDANNTEYRLENFTQQAIVRSIKERTSTDFDDWSSDYGYLHTGSDFFNLTAKYAHSRPGVSSPVDPWLVGGSWFFKNAQNQSCGGTLYYKDACADRKWVYDYFPPVISQQPLKVCSGHGIRGASRVTIDSNYVDPVFGTDEDGNEVLVQPGYIKLNVEYGGRGGYGYCMQAPAGSLAIGRDADSYVLVRTEAPYNSYDYAAYYSTNARDNNNPTYSWFNYAKYNYHSDGVNVQGETVKATEYEDFFPVPITTSYSDAIQNLSVVACPYTTGGSSWNLSLAASKKPQNSVSLSKNPKDCLNALTGYSHNNNYLEKAFMLANSKTLTFTGGDSVKIPKDLNMGVDITAFTYNNGALEPANCSIPGGIKGYDVKFDPNSIAPDKSIPESVSEDDTDCSPVWESAGVNDGDAYGARKYTYPTNGPDGRSGLFSDDAVRVFPFDITMTRVVNLDANTYGYAGRAGESISMYVPKLTGTLEFDIGAGGDAGVFGDVASRSGKPGNRTVVWRKSEGVPDNLKCEFSAEGTVNHPDKCSAIAVAKGGLGYRNGAVGKKIVIRGALTCNEKDEDGNWKVEIDGCLDDGAGPYESGSAGNSLRFAEDSHFYIIPELDAESTTKSAIQKFFENKGLNLPGSGGDGGYSFIKELNGAETVTANKHTNFNPDSMRAIGAGEWQTTGTPYQLTSNRENISSEQLQFGGYKCYKKKDEIAAPRDLPEGIPPQGRTKPEVQYGHTAFCKPENGMPGAVVIVW